MTDYHYYYFIFQEKWLKFVCSWWGFSQCSPLPMATDMVVAGLMHMPPSMEEVMPQEQWVSNKNKKFPFLL